MTIRLDEGAAEAIIEPHGTCSHQIDRSATTMPREPNAGIADIYVARILEELCRTSAEIAVANQVTARLVRETTDDLNMTDEDVRRTFDTARQGLE